MTSKKQKGKGWVRSRLESPEFQRLLAREDYIEDFLDRIRDEMARQGVTKKDLADRMQCSPANVTQVMGRTRNLTASTMVDLAFHLGLGLTTCFGPLGR